jgi:AraC-like DNA-binding protein
MRSVAEFEQAAVDGFVPLAAAPRQDFRAQISVYPLSDSIILMESRSTAIRTSRTNRMVARKGRDDLLVFSVHLAGIGRLSHGEQQVALRPGGGGTLYESRHAWDLDISTPTHSLMLRFPRSALGSRGLDSDCALDLDPALPAMQLLTSYFGQMTRLSEDLTAAQRHDAGLVAIDMLGMALRGAPATVPDESSAGEVLLAMMRRHVREHLGDTGLTAASLARRHHVSVRHAQALFGKIGHTPGAYIREQRLLAAKAMLSDPAFARRGVAEIAAGVGIVELRTFERAFVRRYGLTPAQWRRESMPRP